ncbi:MAG: hypothetical protein SOH58_02955 [Olsenella sp.]|jgi:hypothetical protein
MSQAATKIDATSQAAEPATSAVSETPAEPARDPMPRGMRIGESVFDIAYLLYDLVAGITFFSLAAGRTVFVLYGLLALVLGAGDAFHLVPRVQMHLFGVRDDTQARLGRGTQVASVTMTVFYVLLYLIWLQLFPGVGATPRSARSSSRRRPCASWSVCSRRTTGPRVARTCAGRSCETCRSSSRERW